METKKIMTADELQQYVGTFAKVGNNYGLIDEVYNDINNCLGFVWSTRDSWTGQLVHVRDVQFVDGEEDKAKAKSSALDYFRNELESDKRRLERETDADNITRLVNLISHCEFWLARLTK